MKQVQKNIAFGLINLILINSTLGIASCYATDNSLLLLNDVKTLRASIDSGNAKPAAAVDTFSTAIADQNVSVDDVNAFVRTQMNDEQFNAYQGNLNTALKGIDPSTLKPDEIGQIVGQAVADVQTTGLYWDGCASIWTGAALIAAAVVAGVFAIVKSKSAASIQADYAAKIAQQQKDTAASLASTQASYTSQISSTQASYGKQISDTNNWQTAFPKDIANANSSIGSYDSDAQSASSSINNLQRDISNEESTASSYQEQAAAAAVGTEDQIVAESNYNSAEDTISSDQSKITSLNQQISGDDSNISYEQTQIANYEKLTATYTADPAQAAIDAAALGVAEDKAVSDLQTAEPIALQQITDQGNTNVTNLQTTETQDVAAVPANQALAKKLAIGGGIGAAIGAGLLIYGIKSDNCGSN
jgi:hypothetical protein